MTARSGEALIGVLLRLRLEFRRGVVRGVARLPRPEYGSGGCLEAYDSRALDM
jgi:hypothetical protein